MSTFLVIYAIASWLVGAGYWSYADFVDPGDRVTYVVLWSLSPITLPIRLGAQLYG